MVAHVVFSGDRVTTASVVKGNSTHIMRGILRHRNRVKGLRTPHCLLHLDLPFPSYGPRDILSKFRFLISKVPDVGSPGGGWFTPVFRGPRFCGQDLGPGWVVSRVEAWIG